MAPGSQLGLLLVSWGLTNGGSFLLFRVATVVFWQGFYVRCPSCHNQPHTVPGVGNVNEVQMRLCLSHCTIVSSLNSQYIYRNPAVSQKTLQVSPGQNVTLPCTTTEKIQDIRKTIVEWKKNESFVLVFRNGRLDTDNQDPQFKNRAELADPELKNGNLSLILKKTQLNDSGVYQCKFVGAKSHQKTETSVPKPITNVTLEVKAEETSSGHEAGVGPGHLVIYVLVAAVVVVVSAAGVFLYKKRKQEPEVDQNVDPEQAAPLS